MHCSHCGREVVEDAAFCHRCGVSLSPAEDVKIATSDPLEDTIASRAHADMETVETKRDDLLGRRSAGRDNIREEERLLWEGGHSVAATWPYVIALGAMTALLLVGLIATSASATAWGYALLLALVVWVAALLRFLYWRWSVHYLLTTQRLIHKVGLLRRVTHRIDVITIDDVAFEQSLVQRFLGVGKIRVLAEERDNPQLVMTGIKNVAEVANLIDNARRYERQRRGLHIETV